MFLTRRWQSSRNESLKFCTVLVQRHLFQFSISKFAPFLEDATLARHCIVVLRNLCNNQEYWLSIIETLGCITSIAMLIETDRHDEDLEHALRRIVLTLCSQRVEYCQLVMDECDIFPALFDVSVNGSALELLRLLSDTNHDDEE
ncbi:hypothetical protein V6N13_126958 [Hibiscus sabdariffa]|uniref:Uncharacterized protein n=1 Tax=Hibiscus sabdariffa TaxID=183260 RepID=A0ABR2REC1_9ROSI